mmetsp:Transcript_26952/g.63032  ORF Transcript_26952/g.63032 Transcript_26952/m.63032 type:complete len:108 (+) Transcript_26952:1059-1382(+)
MEKEVRKERGNGILVSIGFFLPCNANSVLGLLHRELHLCLSISRRTQDASKSNDTNAVLILIMLANVSGRQFHKEWNATLCVVFSIDSSFQTGTKAVEQNPMYLPHE